MKRVFGVYVCLLLAAGALMARELTPPEQARWHALSENFRCPTCQSGSIADSPAGLAEDLRQEVKTQIIQGKSDAEIRQFMIERYGQFITYEPPFNAVTSVLWLAPLVFVLALLLGLWRFVRRRQQPDHKENA